jgi:hypothetical protein
MDYDQTTIAATDDAARGYPPAVLRLWLDRVAAPAAPAPRVILDIGCSTGPFTHPLAERFQAARHRYRSLTQNARGRTQQAVERPRQDQSRVGRRAADERRLGRPRFHVHDAASLRRPATRCSGMPPRAAGARTDRAQRHTRLPLSAGAVSSRVPGDRRDRVAVPQRSDRAHRGAGLSLEAYELVRHPVAASWQDFADKLALHAAPFSRDCRTPVRGGHRSCGHTRAATRAAAPIEHVFCSCSGSQRGGSCSGRWKW